MKSIKRLMMFLMCILPAYFCMGQPDTATTAGFQDGFNIKGKYTDRNRVWALNATGEFMDDHTGLRLRYGVSTSFEYRLYKQHTVSTELGMFMFDQGIYTPSKIKLNFNLGYRFYYNLNHRMSRGLIGNNFNANYIVLSPNVTVGYKRLPYKEIEWDFNSGMWKITSRSSIKATPGLKVGYGIQRTAGKRFNFDCQGGFQIEHDFQWNRPFSALYFQVHVGYILK